MIIDHLHVFLCINYKQEVCEQCECCLCAIHCLRDVVSCKTLQSQLHSRFSQICIFTTFLDFRVSCHRQFLSDSCQICSDIITKNIKNEITMSFWGGNGLTKIDVDFPVKLTPFFAFKKKKNRGKKNNCNKKSSLSSHAHAHSLTLCKIW